ncbi:MAG: hypothetical protein IPK26_04455 [Planctomycetes bacterium]|nr:hypothetical protein [Planctomycetota bacterium]
MSRKKGKKGMNPVVAVLLLAMGGGVAGVNLLGGGKAAEAPLDPSITGDGSPPAMDDQAGGGELPTAAGEPQKVDLLAKLGSFGKDTQVPHVFIKPELVSPAPAPGQETAPQAVDGWIGVDPPQLTLAVTMVSGQACRALLQGTVVGIGDTIAGCVVTGVTRDTVELLSADDKTLTYDFDLDWPREFRATLTRRAAREKEREKQQASEGDQPEAQALQAPTAEPAVATTKEQAK